MCLFIFIFSTPSATNDKVFFSGWAIPVSGSPIAISKSEVDVPIARFPTLLMWNFSVASPSFVV